MATKTKNSKKAVKPSVKKVGTKKPAGTKKPKSTTTKLTDARASKIIADAIKAGVNTHTDLRGTRAVVRNGKIMVVGDRTAMKKAVAAVKAEDEKRKLAGSALKKLVSKAKKIMASGEVPRVEKAKAGKTRATKKTTKKPATKKTPKKVAAKKPATKKTPKKVAAKKPAAKKTPKKVAAKKH